MAIVTIFSVIFMLMPIGIMSSSKWLATNEGFKNYNVHLNASSMPVIFGSKQLVPSNTRTVNLFSRTGRFLKITQNGKVRGDINTHSRDTLLQVQSFGISYRRIKRADSNTFIAINKFGKPYTQHRDDPNLETLFQEIMEKKMGINYQSVPYGWLLAIKKNGKLKRGMRKPKNGNSPRSAQFMAIFTK